MKKVCVSSHGRQTEQEKRKQTAEVRRRGRQKEIKRIKGDEKSRRGRLEGWKEQ